MACVKCTQEIRELWWLVRCVGLENNMHAFRVDTCGFRAYHMHTSSQQMLAYGECWICR